nr:hypothetical protein CFP56_09600 [Quercus suber]
MCSVIRSIEGFVASETTSLAYTYTSLDERNNITGALPAPMVPMTFLGPLICDIQQECQAFCIYSPALVPIYHARPWITLGAAPANGKTSTLTLIHSCADSRHAMDDNATTRSISNPYWGRKKNAGTKAHKVATD